MKSHLIKKYLKDNGIDFYLITNNDLHLNESPNLDLKDIYKLSKFDKVSDILPKKSTKIYLKCKSIL